MTRRRLHLYDLNHYTSLRQYTYADATVEYVGWLHGSRDDISLEQCERLDI